MSERDSADDKAWAQFWQTNARSSMPTRSTGCLPQRWSAIEEAQQARWTELARNLPEGAHTLDLATGDGCVMRWMLAERSDLSPIGVDLAPELPQPPEGTEVKTGIAMEDLPFADGAFHAVTSQFGFEYGEIERSAAEVARVLRAGGVFAIMVHRGDGPIVEHNVMRREQIAWVLDQERLVHKLRETLRPGTSDGRPALSAAENAVREAGSRFGKDSPAWEIAEAMRRSILMGAKAGAQSILSTVAMIEGQARNEVGRIDSLERACATADDRARLNRSLEALGLTACANEAVCEPDGRAFADFLTFSR